MGAFPIEDWERDVKEIGVGHTQSETMYDQYTLQEQRQEYVSASPTKLLYSPVF